MDPCPPTTEAHLIFDSKLRTYWREAKNTAEKQYADAIKKEWIAENPGLTPPPYPLNFDWGLGDLLDAHVKLFEKVDKLATAGANLDSPEVAKLVKELSDSKRQLLRFVEEYTKRIDKAQPILEDVSVETLKTLHAALIGVKKQLDMMQPGEASGFKAMAGHLKGTHEQWRKAKVESTKIWDAQMKIPKQASMLKAMGYKKYPFDVRAGVGPGLEKAAKAVLKLDMAGYRKAMAEVGKATGQVSNVHMAMHSAARDLKEELEKKGETWDKKKGEKDPVQLVKELYEPLEYEMRSMRPR